MDSFDSVWSQLMGNMDEFKKEYKTAFLLLCLVFYTFFGLTPYFFSLRTVSATGRPTTV